MGTQLAGLSHRVNYLAQNFGFGNAFGSSLSVKPAVILFEFVDFGGEYFFKVVADLAGVFQRIAVDEQRG